MTWPFRCFIISEAHAWNIVCLWLQKLHILKYHSPFLQLLPKFHFYRYLSLNLIILKGVLLRWSHLAKWTWSLCRADLSLSLFTASLILCSLQTLPAMIFSSRSLIIILTNVEPRIDHNGIWLKTFLVDDNLSISFTINHFYSIQSVTHFYFFSFLF